MNPEDYKFLYWVKVLPAKGKPSSLYFLQADSSFDLFTTDAAGFLRPLNVGGISDFQFNEETGDMTIFMTDGNTYEVNLDTRYVTHAQLEETAEEITQHLEWQGLQW